MDVASVAWGAGTGGRRRPNRRVGSAARRAATIASGRRHQIWAQPLQDQKPVRDRDQGHVMVPAPEAAALEVVQAELGCPRQLDELTTTAVGMSPPAYWPPGSPEGRWSWRGTMPCRQGRMSSSRHRAAPHGAAIRPCRPARDHAGAGHGQWQGWGRAPSARAASLASSAALPHPSGDGPYPACL